MTDKEFKRLSRSQLIDIIYQLQLKQEELIAENEKLTEALTNKRLLVSEAGNIAEAALEIHGVMQTAQDAAAHYLEEMEIRANHEYRRILQEAEDRAAAIIEEARRKAGVIEISPQETTVIAEASQKTASLEKTLQKMAAIEKALQKMAVTEESPQETADAEESPRETAVTEEPWQKAVFLETVLWEAAAVRTDEKKSDSTPTAEAILRECGVIQ